MSQATTAYNIRLKCLHLASIVYGNKTFESPESMKTICALPLLAASLMVGTLATSNLARAEAVDDSTFTNAMTTNSTSTNTNTSTSEGDAGEPGVYQDVWERIRRGYKMPTCESPLVDKWVKYYAQDHADYLNRMFNRSGQYLYQVIEDVEARGMPTELALLPFVESAFQPEALSKAKASGLWQFMPATGKTYDLAQNRWRDERQDILESTRAALDYFQYLYGMFNDWHLALAAYNWGEGSVSRAIKRQESRGGQTDYLSLKMPNETANYVPKLEAIKRIVSNPDAFGVTLPDVGNEPYFVTISKPRDIDTGIAAELAGMKVNEFRALNPSFKLPVIVAAHDNMMHLPADKVDSFIDNLASWMDSGQRLSRWTTYVMAEGDTLASVAQRTGMTEAELREVNGIPAGRNVMTNSTLLVRAGDDEQEDITIAAADARLQLSPETTWRRVTYRVRSGDTIEAIAARWHITTKSIVRTNRLRSARLKRGQRLILTVPSVERTPIEAAPKQVAQAQEPATQDSVRLHSVGSRETLNSIAKQYGISVADLRKANPKVSSRLRRGQRLRIPSSGTPVSLPKFYVVKRGDTLMEVSRQTGVSVTQLQRANRLSSVHLRVGQKLEIPSGQESRVQAPKPASGPSDSNEESGPTHRVSRGESLYSIAKRYGVSVSAIQALNNLKSKHVRVGQTLEIPPGSAVSASPSVQSPSTNTQSSDNKTYKVKKGDNLASIARQAGTSIAALKKLNRLRSNRVRVGQTLRLP